MADLGLLEDRLRILLPDNYRDSFETVAPVPMRSAGLVYREGRVAWDEIWASFCDLAMAGGPPHKGRLLEPGTPQEVDQAPEQYREVVAEICRGIHLVTGLYAEASPHSGWVQMYCTSAGMAGWLARAICMENVSAHCQGLVLSLPAGPAFRLEKEIKNVVTVLAKTTHYWRDHTAEDRQQRIAELIASLQVEFPLMQPPLASSPACASDRQQGRGALVASICKATGLAGSDLEASDPGYLHWVGFTCSDASVAIRCMRFLVVSNVLARREDATVFIPLSMHHAERREELTNLFQQAYLYASAC